MDKLVLKEDGPRGSGRYTPFHALWHLYAIGVIKDLTSFASDAWDTVAGRIEKKEQARPTRVVMIDTSVAADHPNLEDAIATDLAIDFFSGRCGVPEKPSSKRLREIVTSAPRPKPGFLPQGCAALWKELLDGLETSHEENDPAFEPTHSWVRPATLPSFSAHGTAMAGLIGARPLAPDDKPIAGLRTFDFASGKIIEVDPASPKIGFAYAGVDPFCEIVPISTNFDPEPEQLVLTLLYAVLVGADVIVLARDFPSPQSLVQGLDIPDDRVALSEALGVGLTEEELETWRLLEKTVLAVSKRIPIVCAAGNGGDDVVLYPGTLSAPDNGIILVGARTAAGQPASYSPASEAIDIYAPSGDGERLDDAIQRLDTVNTQYYGKDHPEDYRTRFKVCGQDGGPVGAFDLSTYSPQDLISTDVPGRAGYNTSPYSEIFGEEGAVLDYRSAYCRFSGTSGAVAVTAGTIALAISAGLLTTGSDGDGAKTKNLLQGDAAKNYLRAEPALDWSRIHSG